MKILFVCSRNKWRSRTAETIFKNHPNHQVRSAGTAPSAKIKINQKLIDWADLIFVMEKKHKDRMARKFDLPSESQALVILDIPDEYQYMDEELIEMLKSSVEDYLDY